MVAPCGEERYPHPGGVVSPVGATPSVPPGIRWCAGCSSRLRLASRARVGGAVPRDRWSS